jgi:hypothetical protein
LRRNDLVGNEVPLGDEDAGNAEGNEETDLEKDGVLPLAVPAATGAVEGLAARGQIPFDPAARD